MGMNIILSLIMGTLLTVIVGTTVVPNYINEMKISQVEEQNLSNQELIKAAIIEYIKQEAKLPKTIEQLKSKTLKDYPNSNLNDETYSFEIDKKTGTLKIFTKLDNSDLKYFENGFKSKDRPKCIKTVDGNCILWENFYLLDKDLYALIKSIKPDYSDPEYLGEFTPENIGKKDEHLKIPPKDGDKDYIVTINPDNEFDIKIVEKVYKENPDGTGNWEDNGDKTPNGGLGYKNGVFISNLKIPYHEWNEETNQLGSTSEQHEKVHCKDTTLSDTEVFVINQNTGLGEIVWVAPSEDSVDAIQNKIFNNSYTPNNICTSNVKDMNSMFSWKTTFNSKVDRWDTSSVTNMKWMFEGAKVFNQEVNFDTSEVNNISSMFYGARSFNKEVNFDTSSVNNMYGMFEGATSFNKEVNFDTSSVTNMANTFYEASSFNKPLDTWDTSNVEDMSWMFYGASAFNEPVNFDTSKVTNMNKMFNSASAFNNGCSKGLSDCPLNWNTKNVTNMGAMFDGAINFNQNLFSWCVSEIATEPSYFDDNTPTWIKTNRQPKWGQWGNCL